MTSFVLLAFELPLATGRASAERRFLA